jgi:hypothetical protein
VNDLTKDGHDWGCVYHLEHDDCTCPTGAAEPNSDEWRIGACVMWLELLATRFREEWPQVASAATDHAAKLRAVLEERVS